MHYYYNFFFYKIRLNIGILFGSRSWSDMGKPKTGKSAEKVMLFLIFFLCSCQSKVL
jgi:hypothetical protein